MTSETRMHEPGFLTKAYFADEMMRSEITDQAAMRRKRALCEKCGRVLSVSAIDASEAQMVCRCGFRTRAPRNSKAYRAAVLRESEREAGR